MRALLAATACLVALLHPGAPAAFAADAVPGRVVVGFSEGSDADARADARRAVDAELVRRLPETSVQVLDVDGSVAAAVRELRERRGVRFAQPDYYGRVAAEPDDPEYGLQWNMRNIRMPEAWDLSTGSPSVRVAVLDTGVDLDHPDLAPVLDVAAGYDVVGRDEVPDDPADATSNASHGTHVAGIAGAVGGNGVGVAGVNWSSRLVPLRVCGKDGSCASSAVAEGLERAAAAGARVANVSIADFPAFPQAVAASIAAHPQLLVVAAAGNQRSDVDGDERSLCASKAPNLVCVAASRSDNDRLSASNYGVESVDLAAPGLNVYSTTIGDYGQRSGTSMAAPHVAGAAALLFSDAPTATVAQVRAALLSTVSASAALRDDVASGGRLDVLGAVLALPGVRVDARPPAITTSRQATFAWHATPAGTGFECRLDDGGWSHCESPLSLDGIADGAHDFAVRAATGGVVAEHAWTVDTRAPAISFGAAPLGAVSSSAALVEFAVDEAAAAECSVDGRPFEACASPLALSGLGDGDHRVTVRATDAAGNQGAAERAWTVDTTAPALGIQSVAPSGSGVRVAFTADAGSTVTCSLDGGAWSACSSPASFARLADGRHTIVVRAADPLGNAGVAGQSFRIAPAPSPKALATEVYRRLRGRTARALARMRPLTVRYAPGAAGTVSVTVAVRGGPVLLSGSRRATSSGRRVALRLARTRKAASALRRRTASKLQVTATLTPSDGRRPVSVARAFRIRR